MRTRHEDDDEIKRYTPAPWQLQAMKMNPPYVCWGVAEDYMPAAGQDKGWATSQSLATWEEFGPWGLDDLNECVNFYFFLDRDSKDCVCDGSGYNAKTRKIADDFYGHSSSTGRGWNHAITQDEVQALVDENRLYDFTHAFIDGKWQRRTDGFVPTAAEVNAWSQKGMGHDAINRCILIKTRAMRLGVWGLCKKCGGEGYVWNSEETNLGLMLWMLHPRKGCSRGVEILKITEQELPAVKTWLRAAAARNTLRFERVM